MTATDKAIEIAGKYAASVIEQKRAEAAIFSVIELARACGDLVFADQMRTGPVAKSGARSHRVWREMLADNAERNTFPMRCIASFLYAKAALT